ncbi:tyrosine-type recombinase/integrase [Streptomyces griseoaurantiacus]|uniref:tyrosine-type recombinase/integrase n=1 Tax=Streptomyces griseoaurantiacus TaxID=68213 RepID=UPI0036B631FE
MKADISPILVSPYARISDTDEERAPGIDRQLRIVHPLLSTNGYTATRDYIDNNKSAFDPDVYRDDFEQWLADFEAEKTDGAVAYHIDRITRQLSQLERIISAYVNRYKRTGLKGVFLFPSGNIDLTNSDGQLYARMLVMMANKSSSDTVRRIADFYRDEALKGKVFSNYPAFYRNKDGSINEDRAVITHKAIADVFVGIRPTAIAEEWRKKGITTARGGRVTGTSEKSWLLRDYLDYWLEDVVKVNRRPATYAQCETIVRLYLKPGIGENLLNRLSVPLVQRYINQLVSDGHSISKVHVIRKVLSAALTRAEREELIARNVARLVDLPHDERKEVKPWSVEEVSRFLEVVRTHRLYAAYLMLFYGLRKGELLGLRWQDIDVTNSKFRVRQQLQRVGRQIIIGPLKTAKSRRDLPLLTPVKLALSEYHEKHRAQDAELVFTTAEGKPLDPTNFLRDFKRICQSNGLRVISVHAIRHTVATLLKSQGVPDRDIQLILGHSRIITTQEVYQHDDADSRRAALQGLTGTLMKPSETKTTQSVRSGLSSALIAGSGCRQLSRQYTGFVDRITSIVSGGAYRIRTDDLFHAMKEPTTLAERVTEIDAALRVQRRRLLLGTVAVNLAVKTTEGSDAELAA